MLGTQLHMQKLDIGGVSCAGCQSGSRLIYQLQDILGKLWCCAGVTFIGLQNDMHLQQTKFRLEVWRLRLSSHEYVSQAASTP